MVRRLTELGIAGPERITFPIPFFRQRKWSMSEKCSAFCRDQLEVSSLLVGMVGAGLAPARAPRGQRAGTTHAPTVVLVGRAGTTHASTVVLVGRAGTTHAPTVVLVGRAGTTHASTVVLVGRAGTSPAPTIPTGIRHI